MGDIQEHYKVLLIAAVVSRYDQAFDFARQQMEANWGKILMESPRFDFTETTYYNATMGDDLKKQLFAFESPIDPSEIAPIKIATNALESEFANQSEHAEIRPLNIDPGYVTEAKLVLATTKDRDHRIYLRDGIFAEVTLYFRRGEWTKSRWTYLDYQRADFQEFFSRCRKHLREQIRK